MSDPIQQQIANLRRVQEFMLNRAREYLYETAASPRFFTGFEFSVQKRKRREKAPELSELRELKARLRRAA
jgi:hypothetical protein